MAAGQDRGAMQDTELGHGREISRGAGGVEGKGGDDGQ